MAANGDLFFELQEQIDRLCEGSLDADGLDHLQQLVLARHEALHFYRGYLQLHALLRGGPTPVLGNASPRPAERAAPAEMIQPPPKLDFLGATAQTLANVCSSPKALVIGVSGALLTYFAVLAISVAISRGPWANRQIHAPAAKTAQTSPHSAVPGSAAETEIGSLAADSHARWARGADPALDHLVRTERRYELSSGRARLQLANGAAVVLQGPATWRLASDKRLELDSGKLSAHVPKSAVGFTVVTPTAEIVDLGTDFSVVVDDRNQSQLAVSQGAVQVVSRPERQENQSTVQPPEPRRVSAGEVVRVTRLAAGKTVVQAGTWDAHWKRQVAELMEPLDEAVPGRHVAYRTLPDGARGNQFDFAGSLGLDFKVLRPIRVYRLGVFDHLGDGIDPESALTVQLWLRHTEGSEDPADDTGTRILATAMVTSESQGELTFGHRFVALSHPVDLSPGDYTIVAHGFSPKNADLNFGFGADSTPARSEVEIAQGAIVPVGSRCLLHGALGVFPSKYEPITVRYGAGSFEFQAED